MISVGVFINHKPYDLMVKVLNAYLLGRQVEYRNGEVFVQIDLGLFFRTFII